MDFQWTWLIAAAVLATLAVIAGKCTKLGGGSGKALGILIDERDRFSLNRLQLVMWTILILSTFLGLLFTDLSAPATAMAIPAELVGLLGISFGTAAAAGAVKDGKNTRRRSEIALGPASTLRKAEAPEGGPPHFAQVVLEEEGSAANKIVNITKFQNFVFTLALGAVYVALTWKARGYPTFDEHTIWLIGISHATYVGGKVPDKT